MVLLQKLPTKEFFTITIKYFDSSLLLSSVAVAYRLGGKGRMKNMQCCNNIN